MDQVQELSDALPMPKLPSFHVEINQCGYRYVHVYLCADTHCWVILKGRYSWVSLRHFAVNLTGGVNLECIDAYAVLEWANDTKLHVFATKHKANTYSEQLIHSDDCVSI
jgi:hypothetical protein